MTMENYFRVLYSAEHAKCWASDPVANSSHHRPPVAWIATWNKTHSQAETDYPILCSEFGKVIQFTARARRVFLANPDKDYSNCLASREAYEVGELDGVCAFTSPGACVDWARSHPTYKKFADNFRYVVFEGAFACHAPEDDGVVVKVVRKPQPPMKLDEFKSQFNILK
jgi:hypothetical protein